MRPAPPNLFKRRIAEGTPQLGYWLQLNSIAATEIAAGSGMDWLVLDMEHGPIGFDALEHHLLAARHGGDAELVVRVPSVDPVLIKRILETGIRSILFPFVQTVEEARLAVASTRYPPAGIRGVAGNNRANRYSTNADYVRTAHEDICVLVQAESPQAVAAIPEYGTIDGLDGIFIGPNDLAANMGLLGQPNAPEVRAAIADALRAIKAAGKAPGVLDFNPEAAGQLIRDGFTFIAVGADNTTLVRGFAPLMDAVRAAAQG